MILNNNHKEYREVPLDSPEGTQIQQQYEPMRLPFFIVNNTGYPMVQDVLKIV